MLETNLINLNPNLIYMASFPQNLPPVGLDLFSKLLIYFGIIYVTTTAITSWIITRRRLKSITKHSTKDKKSDTQQSTPDTGIQTLSFENTKDQVSSFKVQIKAAETALATLDKLYDNEEISEKAFSKLDQQYSDYITEMQEQMNTILQSDIQKESGEVVEGITDDEMKEIEDDLEKQLMDLEDDEAFLRPRPKKDLSEALNATKPTETTTSEQSPPEGSATPQQPQPPETTTSEPPQPSSGGSTTTQQPQPPETTTSEPPQPSSGGSTTPQQPQPPETTTPKSPQPSSGGSTTPQQPQPPETTTPEPQQPASGASVTPPQPSSKRSATPQQPQPPETTTPEPQQPASGASATPPPPPQKSRSGGKQTSKEETQSTQPKAEEPLSAQQPMKMDAEEDEEGMFAKSTSIAALRMDMLRELARLKKLIDEDEEQ